MRRISRIQLQEAGLALRYLGLRNYPLLKNVDVGYHRAVLLRVCYSRRFNFLYSRVPKAANSTIVSTLASHMGLSEDESVATVKDKLNRFPTPRQIARAFKFCVVRDPTRRAVSAYLDKVTSSRGHHKKLFLELGPNPTFADYLELLKEKDFLRNGHYLPQTRILPLTLASYDRIARVETLANDLEDICMTIFGTYHGEMREDWHRTGSDSVLDAHLTPKARSLLIELYRQDYEKLGYAMPT